MTFPTWEFLLSSWVIHNNSAWMSRKSKLKATVLIQWTIIDPQLRFQSILTLLNCYYVILNESNRTFKQSVYLLFSLVALYKINTETGATWCCSAKTCNNCIFPKLVIFENVSLLLPIIKFNNVAPKVKLPQNVWKILSLQQWSE